MRHVLRPLPADGQPPRMTELWAWVSLDPMTDVEGVVAAVLSGRVMPLMSSVRDFAEKMRPVAESVVAASAEPRPTIRLQRFIAVDDESEIQRIANEIRGEMGLPPVEPPNPYSGHQRR